MDETAAPVTRWARLTCMLQASLHTINRLHNWQPHVNSHGYLPVLLVGGDACCYVLYVIAQFCVGVTRLASG